MSVEAMKFAENCVARLVLRARAATVLYYLAWKALPESNHSYEIGYGEIARMGGWSRTSRNTVRDGIKQLVAFGLLEVVREPTQGKGHRGIYRVRLEAELPVRSLADTENVVVDTVSAAEKELSAPGKVVVRTTYTHTLSDTRAGARKEKEEEHEPDPAVVSFKVFLDERLK